MKEEYCRRSSKSANYEESNASTSGLDSDMSDDKFAYLSKHFKKFLSRQRKQRSKSSKEHTNKKNAKEERYSSKQNKHSFTNIVCYHCDKIGHVVIDCPKRKRRIKEEKRGSDSDSSESSSNDKTYFGLMTHSNVDSYESSYHGKAVADFMGQALQGLVSFSPSQMILTAGAASAIEILCFCLADPGHAVLVPTPYNSGYGRILKLRTGVDIIPVPCRSTDNFNISIAALERAYIQAKKRGVKVRAVLISNPSNPIGNLLKRETLYDLLEFTTEKNIHLISDELFVGSVHGENTCASIAEILDTEDFDKSRVHIIYRLSEDLSLPDIHAGVIYSLNDTVLAAVAKFSRFSSISILAQHALILMLSDKQFISEFLCKSQARLVNMHHLFVQGLKDLGINCVSGGRGFSCWVDLSKFLGSYGEKGELEMWEKLLDVAKLNTTPGSSCHCIEPGWFQFCFAALSESDIDVVMLRIRRVISEGNKVDH